jgi:hypothetical protein
MFCLLVSWERNVDIILVEYWDLVVVVSAWITCLTETREVMYWIYYL